MAARLSISLTPRPTPAISRSVPSATGRSTATATPTTSGTRCRPTACWTPPLCPRPTTRRCRSLPGTGNGAVTADWWRIPAGRRPARSAAARRSAVSGVDGPQFPVLRELRHPRPRDPGAGRRPQARAAAHPAFHPPQRRRQVHQGRQHRRLLACSSTRTATPPSRTRSSCSSRSVTSSRGRGTSATSTPATRRRPRATSSAG